MNKKFVSAVCIVLVLLMLFGVLLSVFGGVSALAVTQSEIDELELERDAIRSRQSDIKEQLDALQTDMESVLSRKAMLDEQNELKRQDIEIINQQIEIYDAMIEQKAEEVAEAEAREQEQSSRYRERVRAMEENGGAIWYLTYIFQADNLTNLLARLDDVLDIVTRDKDVEAAYTAAREHVQAVKAEYEEIQARQEEKKDELLDEKAALERQIEEATALIVSLEDDIELYTAAYDESEAERAEIQQRIDELIEQKRKEEEEERKRKEEEERKRREAEAAAAAAAAAAARSSATTGSGYYSSGTNASSGYYSWPSYCTYITSLQGPRIHPIFGTYKNHSGVDIGASYGSAITAAADGSVSIAEYSSSYGNYVVLYHSNGTATLYAHMSSMAVSASDTVTQGQTIGYVGSTGNSTGPHLHFEVRVNGACVDPLQYFDLNFTYAPDA